VKHALAYLRLVATPADDTSFLRVANFPPRGIGAPLDGAAAGRARSSGEFRCSRRWIFGFKGFCVQKADSRTSGRTTALPLPEMVEHVIHRSGLDRALQERARRAPSASRTSRSWSMPPRLHQEDDNPRRRKRSSPLAAFLSHAALEAGEHQAARARTRCR
jgi:DNA helicase-2/ATP-dependent DNA helicase PcrA